MLLRARPHSRSPLDLRRAIAIAIARIERAANFRRCCLQELPGTSLFLVALITQDVANHAANR
eukprot:5530797-Alexandrium_andersonii.AAC.1